MRIGVDASWAVNESAGVGRYSSELLKHLPEVMAKGDQLELFATYLTGLRRKAERIGNWKLEIGNSEPKIRFSHAWVPGLFKEWCFSQARFDPLPLFFDSNLDVYHAHTIQAFPLWERPGNSKLQVPSYKKILTLHDLSYFHFPEHLGRTALRFQELTQRAVKLADLIICDSAATLADAVRLAGAPRGRSRVIPLGLDEAFQRPPKASLLSRVRRQYKLPKHFLLSVGTVEPRKNITRLIQAHQTLPPSLLKEYPLLLAGGLGWKYDDVLREISNLKYQMSNLPGQPVRYLGFVPDEELPALYQLATIFVYPSLLEGFGLPPLEAMAQGTPVIASNVSSLPEVVGRAGLLVHPKEITRLGRAMERLLLDSKLQRRLGSLGRRRAKAFSWRKTAAQTYLVYREVTSVETR